MTTACLKQLYPPMRFHGVDLERGVAYQAEMADGSIYTGRWTGLREGLGEPIFAHADTGRHRTMNYGSCKWLKRLADVA